MGYMSDKHIEKMNKDKEILIEALDAATTRYWEASAELEHDILEGFKKYLTGDEGWEDKIELNMNSDILEKFLDSIDRDNSNLLAFLGIKIKVYNNYIKASKRQFNIQDKLRELGEENPMDLI